MLRELNTTEMNMVSGGTAGGNVDDAASRALNGYLEFGGIGFGGVLGLSDSFYDDAIFLDSFAGGGGFVTFDAGSGDITISGLSASFFGVTVENDLFTVTIRNDGPGMYEASCSMAGNEAHVCLTVGVLHD